MANPILKIGRYEFPLLSVVATEKKDDGNYIVYLPQGVVLLLTEEEKALLDSERAIHEQIMQVWGSAKSAGLRA